MKLTLSPQQKAEVQTGFCIAAFTVVLVAFFYYISPIWAFLSRLISLAAPFLIGFCIAFLLGPLQRGIERLMKRFVLKGKGTKAARLISTLLSILLLVVVVGLFLSVIVPQVVQSISSIAVFARNLITENSGAIRDFLVRYNIMDADTNAILADWNSLLSRLLNSTPSVLGGVISVSGSIASFIINLLIGLITAIYIMLDRERLGARFKKIGYAVMKKDHIETLLFWERRAAALFSGFITGKILDAALIGLLCYFGMLIFGMEYPVLISVIIGVSNIIPFFGPWIGWVPCALILLIVNPMNALWFSIFLLALQQLDGNVIGPFILGDRVGVSALSITIAIVIGGGLFGFVGMLVSVPFYALLYAIIRTVIAARLQKRGLSADTDDYIEGPETAAPDSGKA